MTCNDCLHYECCSHFMIKKEEIECMKYGNSETWNCFTDKSLYIKLPCKVGDKIFYMKVQFQNRYISSGIVEAIFINDCGLSFHVITKEGDSDITNQFLFTAEDAEKALKECIANEN